MQRARLRVAVATAAALQPAAGTTASARGPGTERGAQPTPLNVERAIGVVQRVCALHGTAIEAWLPPLNAVVGSAAGTERERECALLQARLPVFMGGMGLTSMEEIRGAAWVGGWALCWRFIHHPEHGVARWHSPFAAIDLAHESDTHPWWQRRKGRIRYGLLVYRCE